MTVSLGCCGSWQTWRAWTCFATWKVLVIWSCIFFCFCSRKVPCTFLALYLCLYSSQPLNLLCALDCPTEKVSYPVNLSRTSLLNMKFYSFIDGFKSIYQTLFRTVFSKVWSIDPEGLKNLSGSPQGQISFYSIKMIFDFFYCIDFWNNAAKAVEAKTPCA